MKVKDITIEQAKAICEKARTKPNGKVVKSCVEHCPLNTNTGVYYKIFYKELKVCDIIDILNMEIEVLENEIL